MRTIQNDESGYNRETVEEIIGPELVALIERIEIREQDETRRIGKAIALAPSLELARLLLAGERVPWMRLDYLQAERYGLRRVPKDGRVCLDDFNDIPRP